MKNDPELFGVCPFVTAQRLLYGKWSILILHELIDGPKRFNELLHAMPGEMTHTTLVRQLKNLEKEGLIVRKDFGQIPPRVEYSLTELGGKFRDVLNAIEKWGRDYIEYLVAIRNAEGLSLDERCAQLDEH